MRGLLLFLFFLRFLLSSLCGFFVGFFEVLKRKALDLVLQRISPGIVKELHISQPTATIYFQPSTLMASVFLLLCHIIYR